MKLKIPNKARSPFDCDPDQLKELEEKVKNKFSNIRFDTGIRYARHGHLEGIVEVNEPELEIDDVFTGNICGKPTTILMWGPFFD